MKKIVFLFTAFTFLLLIAFAAANSGWKPWKWTFYARKAKIEGFIFIDKNFNGELDIQSPIVPFYRDEFLANAASNLNNKHPLSDANIQLVREGSLELTDDRGFFSFSVPWVKVKSETIKLSTPDLSVKFNLDLKNSLNCFMYIQINRDGSTEIFSLTPKTASEERDVVVLIPGIEMALNEFIPSQLSNNGSQNSWSTAYNLFINDPELSSFDFYPLEYSNTGSLIEPSLNLGCFLHMVRYAYSNKPKIILLGNSAGGLIARHYTISKYYAPRSVTRFLMLSTPNFGTNASHLPCEYSNFINHTNEKNSSVACELLTGSEFLNCLNNNPTDSFVCRKNYKIIKEIQDTNGLNPNVPCAIVGASLKDKFYDKSTNPTDNVSSWVRRWIGPEAEKKVTEALTTAEELLEELPDGDGIVSLESQLISNIPFKILPSIHGQLHRPEDRQDERYKIMKNFIINGELIIDSSKSN